MSPREDAGYGAHRVASGGARLPAAPAGALAAIGGAEAAGEIVERLYERIERDPELAPVFPHFQTGGLAGFLRDWLGGEPVLSSPWAVGLYQRHLEIHVSPSLAERWLGHLEAVLAERRVPGTLGENVLGTLRRVAHELAHAPDAPFADLELAGSCQGVSSRAMRSLEELRAAARKGSVELLAQALRADPGLARRRGAGGASLLWEAAGAGKLEAVELLLAAGADPDAPGTIPFQADIACGSKSKPGSAVPLSPYTHARANRRRAVAQRLLDAGATVDAFDLAYLGEADRLAELLRAEPELASAIDPADAPREVTLLHHAVCGGRLECAEALIARGAEVRRHSRFLLTVAARHDRVDLVQLLLDAGADARRSDLAGPLDPDRRPVAELLVSAGFDVNDTARWGPMLPRICRADVARNSVHRARVLLELGADPDRLGRTGLAPLHYAARGRNARLAELLLEHGAGPDRLDQEGLTAREHVPLSRSKIDPGPVLDVLNASDRA